MKSCENAQPFQNGDEAFIRCGHCKKPKFYYYQEEITGSDHFNVLSRDVGDVNDRMCCSGMRYQTKRGYRLLNFIEALSAGRA